MEKKMRLNYKKLAMALVCALIITMIFNFYMVYTIQKLVQEKMAVKAEAAKPIVLEALIVTNSKCTDCFDAKTILTEIEGVKGIQVTKKEVVDFTSPHAKETIEQWHLKKFPALIVTGDLSRATLLKGKIAELGGIEKEGALLFAEPLPPYTDLDGTIRGHVSTTIIKDDECDQCVDLAPLISQLRMVGVAITDEKTLSHTSSEGKPLLLQYNITKLPMLILSADLAAYEQLAATWKLHGEVASDGSYILTRLPPPYKDLATGKVKGLVVVTSLTDQNCKECYNVTIHKDILTNFGLKISEEKVYDYGSLEGKTIVKKYNITALPTIILSSEAKEYLGLVQAWERVGSIEKDGTFIFRALEVMQGSSYKDLATGTVKQAAAQAVSDE